MGVENIDNIETPLADSQSNSFGGDDTGSAGLDLDTSGEWRLSGGDGGKLSWAAPSLTHSLGPGRREKLAALFSGSYDPKQARLESLSKGVTGYELKKEEPLIGPDGGMVGRGIKAAGDAYQGYIDGQRATMMNTMKHELDRTFTPQLIDGVNTWSHNLLSMTTGIDTGFKPQFEINRFLQPSSWFNTGSGTPPAMGFQVRINPLAPALTGLTRYAGGDSFKASEIVNYGKSGAMLGLSAFSSPANQAAQKVSEQVDKAIDASRESVEWVGRRD